MIKEKDKLIYDLIFSEEVSFEIDVHSYIKNIWEYDRFIESINNILSKSKVRILNEKIIVESNSVIWKIKVKK